MFRNFTHNDETDDSAATTKFQDWNPRLFTSQPRHYINELQAALSSILKLEATGQLKEIETSLDFDTKQVLLYLFERSSIFNELHDPETHRIMYAEKLSIIIENLRSNDNSHLLQTP